MSRAASKDRDSLDLAAVHGTPPIVVLIGLGNASTSTLLRLLDDAWPVLSAELSRPEAGVLMLEPERVVVWHRPVTDRGPLP